MKGRRHRNTARAADAGTAITWPRARAFARLILAVSARVLPLLLTSVSLLLFPSPSSARIASLHTRPTPRSSNVDHAALGPCPERVLRLPTWDASWDGVNWKPTDTLLNPHDRQGRTRWFLRTTLPPLPCGAPHVFLRTFDENVIARLDGNEIGRYVHEQGDYGYPWVLWRVPPTSAPTVLQLEITSRGAHLGITGTPEVGPAEGLIARFVAGDLPSLVLGSCYVAMGLAALAYYLRQRRTRLAQGAFGVFVLALGAYSLSNARARQLVVDSPSVWLRAEYLILFLVPLAGFAFFDAVFPPRGPWRARPLPMAFGAFLAGALGVSMFADPHALAELLTPFMLLCTLALPAFLTRLAQEWRSSRSPFAHALVWVCAALVIAGAVDFLASFGGRIPDVGWLKYATVGLVAAGLLIDPIGSLILTPLRSEATTGCRG